MISAFKHIRLSGYNVTPVEGGSKLRLGFGGTGLAYYSELTGVSGYLQTLIDTANADVNSISFVTGDGLSYTAQGAVRLTGTDGITISVDEANNEIRIVGNSGYFKTITDGLSDRLNQSGTYYIDNFATKTSLAQTGSTLSNYNIAYSGFADAKFVAKSSNQVFTKTLDAGSDAYAVIYPVPFPYNTIPKVQATLEVDQNSDVMYNLSIRSITSGGYTGLLSDNILEAGAKIHTFASTQ
jgi:hypothetical protein